MPAIPKEKVSMTCLFFNVRHSFSLPIITKSGVEIFNPQKVTAIKKTFSEIYKKSNLGLRSNSLTDEEFLQVPFQNFSKKSRSYRENFLNNSAIYMLCVQNCLMVIKFVETKSKPAYN